MVVLAPSNVTQTSATDTSVGVSWDHEVGTLWGVYYEYRVNSGLPVNVGRSTWIVVPGLEPNKTYSLQVRVTVIDTLSPMVLPTFMNPGTSDWSPPTLISTQSSARLVWSEPEKRYYEAGIDRGVLYPRTTRAFSNSNVEVGMGQRTFTLASTMASPFPIGSRIRFSDRAGLRFITGTVAGASSTSVVVRVSDYVGSGVGHGWNIQTIEKAVPWNGLLSVEESGSEGVKEYYMDGRPYLQLPTPKEYSATLSAYTYPDEFATYMGLADVGGGVYLDSQASDSFDLSYRTMIGNTTDGADHAFKIHVVYNAVVAPEGASYATNTEVVGPAELQWEIQALPMRVDGYRPTAHVILDTRKMDSATIARVEDMLYGSTDSEAGLPHPQVLFDMLRFGDNVFITNNGDGTWTAEGSHTNVYTTSNGGFQINNANATNEGGGVYTISSTEL